MGQVYDRLTRAQQAVVDVFEGSAASVSKALGITMSAAYTQLSIPEIKSAIKERFKERMDPLIAARDERLAFWTSMMRGEAPGALDPTIRLRASELLGKANLDFGERKVIEATVTQIVPKTELEDRISQIIGDDDWMS